ncbi:LANO_0C03994g1_1 [Lachancea nothofagi CBS 11611]|uniref:LANO_0C03994g1_1 n=1 Tax=Lachancea nothofagi CBS 11611 TaxID=1266666 RepID=A0A1G4J6H0_9SACH|nr:LANO_0C03994g1_1 [Lachancea nothofagi CBS 11611]
MAYKRNLRVLTFTSVLLVLIYFIVQNAHTTSSASVGNSGSISATVKSNTTPNPAKQKAEAKPKGSAKVDSEVDEEIENIKHEVGIKEDISGKLPKTDLATHEDPAFDAVKAYQMILVSSPMIVFSKSYCPYSKRLKELLHQEFLFTPEYVVVELDLHKHGAELQEYVGTKTGRTTVPNVVINGVSRGGCDDLKALQADGKLLSSLKEWAGKTLTVTKNDKPSNN